MSAIHQGLDSVLEDWMGLLPEPQLDDNAWESLASNIDVRIELASVGQGEDAWLAAPLPAEQGEPIDISDSPSQAGEKKMNDPQPKKVSLKELAERVSMAPSSRASMASDSGADIVPVSSRVSAPAVSVRPSEASDDDSGLVDLAAVREQAESTPDDKSQQPGTAGMFEDEDDAQEQKKTAASAAASAAKKKQEGGNVIPYVGGGVVALIAIAAAFVLVINKPGDVPGSSQNKVMAPQSVNEKTAAAPAPNKELDKAAKGKSKGVALEDLPKPEEEHPEGDERQAAAATGKGAVATGHGAGGTTARRSRGAPGAAPVALGGAAPAKKTAGKKPAASDNPDDLQGAMASAVGASETKASAPKAKSAGPDPSTIPERPSQGAIHGALATVRGAARACVAGMSAPSRASITFGSSGRVRSVSVSGPAAGTSAAGCIKGALRRANVGPFKQSSYTIGLTLRP